MKNLTHSSGNKPNRSMPESTIIPELSYSDMRAAVAWLCEWFGFKERLRIGDHRTQLVFGDGAVIVTQRSADRSTSSSAISNYEGKMPDSPSISIMVRISDVETHFKHIKLSGAEIINPPTTYPYGERQYTVEDIDGYHWTFSQTVDDIDPINWGGLMVS